MATMTSKERVEKTVQKGTHRHHPIFSGQGMVTIQAIQKMASAFPGAHLRQYLADSAATTAELFGFDAVIIPYDMCTIPRGSGPRRQSL